MAVTQPPPSKGGGTPPLLTKEGMGEVDEIISCTFLILTM